MGLACAGFKVIGVDLVAQLNYPFYFVQEDALEYVRWADARFALIWASPPCQTFTAYKRRPNHVGPVENLIPQMRQLLQKTRVPFVIENVPGAPLENPITLCGSMFGLDVRRHRLFEAHGFEIPKLTCRHHAQTPRFPCAFNDRSRRMAHPARDAAGGNGRRRLDDARGAFTSDPARLRRAHWESSAKGNRLILFPRLLPRSPHILRPIGRIAPRLRKARLPIRILVEHVATGFEGEEAAEVDLGLPPSRIPKRAPVNVAWSIKATPQTRAFSFVLNERHVSPHRHRELDLVR